jgi:hypothetical protein
MRHHIYDAEPLNTDGTGAKSMDESKLDVVRDYFHKKFPGRGITEKHDFDLGAQTFMIARDTGSLLVKIRQNLIENNDTNQIREMLDKWDIVDILKQHPEVEMLVISGGPRPYK